MVFTEYPLETTAESISGVGFKGANGSHIKHQDGEPSICELVRRVRELRAEGATTIDEISQAGDFAANGVAERAILTAWMVHHAAQVICACSVGTDGLTPCRRLKGRKFGTPLAGFGERVWLREPWRKRTSSIRDVSRRGRPSRHIVVDFDSRFRFVRMVKRASPEDRWTIASPRGRFSAGDLEVTVTPAEFTCSRGTRGKVNPAAQRLEGPPADALPIQPRSRTSPEEVAPQAERFSCTRNDRSQPRLQSTRQWRPFTRAHRGVSNSWLRKTEEGRIRLQAAATLVGDALVGRAAKRVRFASDQVDGGAGVSTDHATESQSSSTSPTPSRDCIIQFCISTSSGVSAIHTCSSRTRSSDE